MAHRAKSNRPKDCPYIGKGGLKLFFAIENFNIDVKEKVAIDFGSHQGGFVDCLLKNGASKVYAVDTCYGTLDWKLRNDKRVVVCERMNAMHWKASELVDVITIDVGWTKQQYIIPSAIKSIKHDGIILSLLKPQYEVETKMKLSEDEVKIVIEKKLNWFKTMFNEVNYIISPYKGSGGNVEAWFYLKQLIT